MGHPFNHDKLSVTGSARDNTRRDMKLPESQKNMTPDKYNKWFFKFTSQVAPPGSQPFNHDELGDGFRKTKYD